MHLPPVYEIIARERILAADNSICHNAEVLRKPNAASYTENPEVLSIKLFPEFL